MRRHYSNYFKGMPNFKEYRQKLVTGNKIDAVNEVFEEIIEKYEGMENFSTHESDSNTFSSLS